MIGLTIGHYRIIGLLGAGGMGHVYHAEDTRLGRGVAIKMLPREVLRDPASRERFRREARLVASVNHPNICTLYDVGEVDGQPFLVLELLEGQTLQKQIADRLMPVTELVSLSLQLSDALATAHDRGIVHRDLKPANVFITKRGDVKVLDFGIAKLADQSDTAETVADALTDVGVTVGTTSYMAPEQVRGEPVDARADLFALGALLYEMATGQQAFSGATSGMIADAVLNRTPVCANALNPSVPALLDDIIVKLLEKDRALRYQHAADVGADLKRLQRDLSGTMTIRRERSGVSDAKSVAVLPFRNMSADSENVFFSDGIAEDLISALTRIPGLKVASRASAFRFRDQNLDLAIVGDALKVGALVEGSVRRSGNRLRVTAQLVNLADGYQIWSERFDREMADVFDIQDEIVGAIVKVLAPALMGEAKSAVQRPTGNLEAYELYLKGRHYWHQRSPATVGLAIRAFEQAIALDPDYALAYAGLADCWGLYRPYGWMPAAACEPQARAAVDRAMALAPDLAEVQYSKALHVLFFDPHWRAAEAHFQRAIELNPRWSVPHVYYGVFLAVSYRFDEAGPALDAGIEMDPLSPFLHGLAALALSSCRRFEDAERHARRALELQGDYLLALWVLSVILHGVGRPAEAVKYAERVVAMSRAPTFVGMLAQNSALLGRRKEVAALVQELDERRSRGEYISPIAVLMVALGQRDVATVRQALQVCVDDGTPFFSLRVAPGPELEDLRSDPRIDALLDQLSDGVRPR